MGALIVNVEGIEVALARNGDRVVAHIEAEGKFEPETLKEWASICRGGGTVIDVGAYTGLFTIVAAKLGCNVIAFEPMPENFQRLEYNCRLNDVRPILCRQAVSNKAGRTKLHYSHGVRGMTSGASMVRKSGHEIEVETVTIDDLHLESCRGLKIDVERGEPLVLEGARRTIDRCHTACIVEVLDQLRMNEVARFFYGTEQKLVKVLDVRNWLFVHDGSNAPEYS